MRALVILLMLILGTVSAGAFVYGATTGPLPLDSTASAAIAGLVCLVIIVMAAAVAVYRELRG